jgi:hypothetical protein
MPLLWKKLWIISANPARNFRIPLLPRSSFSDKWNKPLFINQNLEYSIFRALVDAGISGQSASSGYPQVHINRL